MLADQLGGQVVVGVRNQFRASSHRRSLKWMSLPLPCNIGLEFAHTCTFTVYFPVAKVGEVSVNNNPPPPPLVTQTTLMFPLLSTWAKLIQESLAETHTIPSNLWRSDWQETKPILTTVFLYYEISADEQLHIRHYCKLAPTSSCPCHPFGRDSAPQIPTACLWNGGIVKSINPCAASPSCLVNSK